MPYMFVISIEGWFLKNQDRIKHTFLVILFILPLGEVNLKRVRWKC